MVVLKKRQISSSMRSAEKSIPFLKLKLICIQALWTFTCHVRMIMAAWFMFSCLSRVCSPARGLCSNASKIMKLCQHALLIIHCFCIYSSYTDLCLYGNRQFVFSPLLPCRHIGLRMSCRYAMMDFNLRLFAKLSFI